MPRCPADLKANRHRTLPMTPIVNKLPVIHSSA